ncbi:uncharacterized protein LOC9632433 [Selaginella moellendorffii]|uniref:uncharacterized protein LOC9632433 n=1 Tax=Selaginella moellendorffii TaxID=88036 RepID=UPI000D1C4BB0|nr:uncharacterized protein LOC9632433 [Selaginella moellendorffii]|eukprot:XP_024530976.1 uncharacterized protein LOC9632433 [Selaginella moellendorffii]
MEGSANLGLGLRRPSFHGARNSSIRQGQSCRAKTGASLSIHYPQEIQCRSAFNPTWTRSPTWTRRDLQSPPLTRGSFPTWTRRDLQSPLLTRDVPKVGNGYTMAIFSSLPAWPASILSSILAWLVSSIQVWFTSHIIVTWLWSQLKKVMETLATFILAACVTPLVVAVVTFCALHLKGPCGGKEEIDRKEYAQKILHELEMNSGYFYFLYGSHASGKSTLIKKALSLKQRGYIYVHMHEGVNVRDTREWLSEKILQQLPFGLLWSNVLSKVDFFTRILPGVAWVYGCLHGKTPIMLVVDGVTAFDDKSEALRSILGVAKYVADNRLASFVIVGSGGELVYISRISSALSRARMLRVESVSKKILVEYIMKKYKELESRESEVHELLRLTGSKILSINLWARMLLHKPIEQVKAAYMEEVVYHCFARAGLLDQENRPWVVKLLEALRGNGGRLHVRKLQKIVPLSKVLRINSSNLFSINEKRELCFESEVYMDYAEEILAEDYAVTTNMKKTE